MDNPVVFFHGFDREELFVLMNALKMAAAATDIDPASIAFASSTPNNLDWKIKKLIREVRREHERLSGNEPA